MRYTYIQETEKEYGIQTINTAVWYYPCFYMLQSCVMSGKADAKTAGEGLARYRTNYAVDLVACWQVWVPAQLINFSIVPVHLRVTFAAGVSCIWSCILSSMRGEIQNLQAIERAASCEEKHTH